MATLGLQKQSAISYNAVPLKESKILQPESAISDNAVPLKESETLQTESAISYNELTYKEIAGLINKQRFDYPEVKEAMKEEVKKQYNDVFALEAIRERAVERLDIIHTDNEKMKTLISNIINNLENELNGFSDKRDGIKIEDVIVSINEEKKALEDLNADCERNRLLAKNDLIERLKQFVDEFEEAQHILQQHGAADIDFKKMAKIFAQNVHAKIEIMSQTKISDDWHKQFSEMINGFEEMIIGMKIAPNTSLFSTMYQMISGANTSLEECKQTTLLNLQKFKHSALEVSKAEYDKDTTYIKELEVLIHQHRDKLQHNERLLSKLQVCKELKTNKKCLRAYKITGRIVTSLAIKLEALDNLTISDPNARVQIRNMAEMLKVLCAENQMSTKWELDIQHFKIMANVVVCAIHNAISAEQAKGRKFGQKELAACITEVCEDFDLLFDVSKEVFANEIFKKLSDKKELKSQTIFEQFIELLLSLLGLHDHNQNKYTDEEVTRSWVEVVTHIADIEVGLARPWVETITHTADIEAGLAP